MRGAGNLISDKSMDPLQANCVLRVKFWYCQLNMLVWSKNSCGFTMVVFQQSTQSFASANGVGVPVLFPRTWQQSFIASSLDDGVPDDNGCHTRWAPAGGRLSQTE